MADRRGRNDGPRPAEARATTARAKGAAKRPEPGRGRRSGVLALVALVAIALGGALYGVRDRGGTLLQLGRGATVRVPDLSSLSPLRAKIVSLAESQIGYSSNPSGTYCNKYSAYWYSGADDCGNGNLDEQWCADFAAWVWRQAGAAVTYEYKNGDLNSSAASFYEWGASNGTWHAAGSGYVPVPGDVAVYGLDIAHLVAVHVAIVIGYQSGDRGPTAVNGDGDLTGFSVVEVRADEYLADTDPGSAPLSGYVSPSDRPGGAVSRCVNRCPPCPASVSPVPLSSSFICGARDRSRMRPTTTRS